MASRVEQAVDAKVEWLKAAANLTTATPEAEGRNGTAATIGAEATAVGDATVAMGNVSLEMTDRGRVTTVQGEAATSGAATGGATSASADTYADVKGADFVFTYTVKSSGSGAGSANAASTTKVFALAFDDFDFPGGPIQLDFVHTASPDGLELRGVDRNVAQVNARAVSEGDATLALTQTNSSAAGGSSWIAGDAYGFLG